MNLGRTADFQKVQHMAEVCKKGCKGMRLAMGMEVGKGVGRAVGMDVGKGVGRAVGKGVGRASG